MVGLWTDAFLADSVCQEYYWNVPGQDSRSKKNSHM